MTLTGELTREAAQEAARRELTRHEYAASRPSALSRALGWLGRELTKLLSGASGNTGAATLAGLLVLAVLAVAVTVVLGRVGPAGKRAGRGRLFETGVGLTAADHRAAAEAAAAQGRWPDAVRERMRAVVRELESRGVLDVRPGRTADEVADDAGSAIPQLRPDLRRAATLFDEIWYGGRPADKASYDVVVGVDARVATEALASPLAKRALVSP